MNSGLGARRESIQAAPRDFLGGEGMRVVVRSEEAERIGCGTDMKTLRTGRSGWCKAASIMGDLTMGLAAMGEVA